MEHVFWGHCMECGRAVYGQDICEKCWHGVTVDDDVKDSSDNNDLQ